MERDLGRQSGVNLQPPYTCAQLPMNVHTHLYTIQTYKCSNMGSELIKAMILSVVLSSSGHVTFEESDLASLGPFLHLASFMEIK